MTCRKVLSNWRNSSGDTRALLKAIAKSARPDLRHRFLSITAKFRDVLKLHARMLMRVKNASEGMIQAIAREVERANAPTRTYGPRLGAPSRSPGAMVFNKVV